MDVTVNPTFDAIINKLLLPYQRADVLSNDRFRWNCWSRQTGKSFTKALRRIIRGIARKRNQLFLSAGERQSRELMMKAAQHCKALKIAFSTTENPGGLFDGAEYRVMEIHIPEANLRIIGLPANPKTARGFTGDVFLDEFAMHQYDREIWGAMFPSVMRGGGELDVASTPKGKLNKFHDLRDNPAFNHHTLTINDAVDQGLDVDPVVLRAAMGDDELYRQEFLCEFVDEATAFLTLEMIQACENDSLPYELDIDTLRANKGNVVVGVDIGRRHDLTVIWALEQLGDQFVSLGLIELRSTSFREQFEILSDVLKCRCVRRCCIDATGLGMQLAEQTQERFGEHTVEPVTFTVASKAQMAGLLRVKMEAAAVQIPVSKVIREDLHSIEKSVTLDGQIRLRATRHEGSHADRFWAVALAVYAGSENLGPPEIMVGEPTVFAGGLW